MEKENDIGAFFQRKLESGNKSPNDELWNRIEDSLDKDDKQRKGFFIFWITAIGLPTLLTFGWLMVAPTNNSIPEKQNSGTEIVLDSTNTDQNVKVVDTIIKDTIPKRYSINEISVKDSITENTKIPENTGNPENTKITERTKSKKSNSSEKTAVKHKKVTTNDGYSVKSTYHYFNSDSGEHIESSNKAEIDSLMNRKSMTSDSLVVIQDKASTIQLTDSL